MKKNWKYNRKIKNVATVNIFFDFTVKNEKKLAQTKKNLVELQQEREEYLDILMVNKVTGVSHTPSVIYVGSVARPEAFPARAFGCQLTPDEE